MSEHENFATLREIAPDASDERIRAVLKKHANLDMAVSALLDDQNDVASSNDNFIGPLPGPLQAPLPEDDQWNRGRGGALNSYNTNRNNSPVQIDLTKASPQSSTMGLASTSFMDDADKSKWALVPTSQSSTTAVYGPQPDPGGPYVATQSQQDDDLSMAINASLQTSMLDANSSAAFVELSLSQIIRLNPDIPVTLRSRNPHMIHVALLAHAMYHVPQVRQAFSGILPNVHTTSKEITSFWKVMARLEMGTQSDVVMDEFLPKDVRYSTESSGMLKEVKESMEALYTQFAQVTLSLPPPFMPGLFYSKIWYPPSFGSGSTFWSSDNIPYSNETNTRADLPIIPITANVNSSDNSLVSYLHELTWTRKLDRAADVLVFQVTHEDGPVTTTSRLATFPSFGSTSTGTASTKTSSTSKVPAGPSQKHLLQFPALLYVDPFLLETREITALQRGTRMAMETTVRQSETRLNGLGGGLNNAPLKNLRASIKYFEDLALDDGDERRSERKRMTLAMLKEVLARVESEIEILKENIQRTKEEMAHVYDVTGLQKNPYDLRAVLMWDGVYGRTHTYSYVKARNGKWYKSVENIVNEVDEKTVLSDSTGLHMGAGPFMLLYSKTLDASPTSEMDDMDEKPKADSESEPQERPEPQRTYSSVAEDYAQWHPVMRQAVRNWNGQFRTALEDAGIVDAEGRIAQDPSNEAGPSNNTGEKHGLVLPEDPLARMYFEETEDSMDYDSDAKDIDQEVVMDTSASMAGWGLSTEPVVSQESDIASWGPQEQDSGKWDNPAASNYDWGPAESSSRPSWDDAIRKASQEDSDDIQGTITRDLEEGIQVQVTRDIETDADHNVWGHPDPS